MAGNADCGYLRCLPGECSIAGKRRQSRVTVCGILRRTRGDSYWVSPKRISFQNRPAEDTSLERRLSTIKLRHVVEADET